MGTMARHGGADSKGERRAAVVPLRPHIAEGEKSRLVAWADELRAVHTRLRAALAVVRTARDAGYAPAAEAQAALPRFVGAAGDGQKPYAGSAPVRGYVLQLCEQVPFFRARAG